jgi:hypothetical protein
LVVILIVFYALPLVFLVVFLFFVFLVRFFSKADIPSGQEIKTVCPCSCSMIHIAAWVLRQHKGSR